MVENVSSEYGGALPHLLGMLPSLLSKVKVGALELASKGEFVESLTVISDSQANDFYGVSSESHLIFGTFG